MCKIIIDLNKQKHVIAKDKIEKIIKERMQKMQDNKNKILRMGREQ